MALLWAMLLPHSSPAQAQAPPEAEKLPPLEYIRIEVPENFDDNTPTFGYDFIDLPIELAEFEKLLQAANAPAGEAGLPAVVIRSAKFTGRLENDALVGTARLDIERQQDPSKPSDKAKLLLDGCGVAVAEARWENGRPAKFGLAADGKFVLPVEQSGVLIWSWSLAGRRESAGNLLFDLALPPTVDGQISVELPAEYRALASRGVGQKPEPMDAGWQRWPIQLGGLRDAQILVSPVVADEAVAGALLASQRSDYKIDTSGFQLSAEIQLEARDLAVDLRRLAVQLDPGLQLVGVTLDGQKISWQTSSEAPQVAALHVDRALPAFGRARLMLSAVGAAPLGRAAPLPDIRPTGAIWQAGAALIQWDDSLQLDALDVSDGGLQSVRAAESTNDQAHVSIAFYDPAGRAKVKLSPRRGQITVRPTYAWRQLADRTLGRLSADLTCASGGTHELTGQLAAGWLIDEDDVRLFSAVDSPDAPATPVAHRIEPTYDSVADKPRPLRIIFDPPLTSGRPLRLEVTATNHEKLPAESFPLSSLEFLQWDDVVVGETTGAITASSPQSARLQGVDDMAFLPLEHLDKPTLAWLAPQSSVAVFSSKSGIGQVGVQLVRGARRLSASIDVSVLAEASRITESYDIRCTPDAAGVERLRIAFWPPRAAPPQWSFPPELQPGDVTAVRVSPASSNASDGNEAISTAEVWELAFRQRQTSPIAIAAQRRTHDWSGGAARISLAAVADATSQTGQCVVRSSASTPLEVHAWGARQAAAAPSIDAARTWGSFRYTPSPSPLDSDVGIEIVRRSAEQQASLAWRLVLETNMTGGPLASHRATWLVHNEGLGKLHLRMPTQAVVQSVAINGGAAVFVHGDEDDAYSITLPPDEPLVRLSVDYWGPQAAAGLWCKVAPAAPQLDIPVLRSSWRVSLPRGYAAAPDERLYAQAAQTPRLRQQLLGPFAGASDHGQSGRHQTVAANAESTGEFSASDASAQHASVTRLAEKLAQQGTTWGQALLDYQLSPADGPAAANRLLLIDSRAVAGAGIAPEGSIVWPAGTSSPQDVSQLLDAAGLALVVTRDYMLLTGADFALARAQQLTGDADSGDFGPPRGGVVWVTGQSLAQWMSQPLSFATRLTTPQIWASSLAESTPSWGDMHERTLAALTGAAEVYEISLPSDASGGLVVYNVAAFAALAFAALLAVVTVGWWWSTARLSWILAAMLLAGAGTLLLSQPWAWVGSGLFVGLLIAALFRLGASPQRHRATGASITADSPSQIGRVVRTACWLPAAILLAAMSTHGRAADPDALPPYPVWYRVDDQGRPTGYVDLPKKFLAELNRRAAAATPPRPWILTDANYQLQMQWHASAPTLQVQELQIDYTFDVLDDVSHVEIPVPRGGMTLLDDGATLDDLPVDITWRLRDPSIRIPIEAPGEHHLRLRVRPTVAAGVDADQFQMDIPPAPRAKLHVSAPRDATDIELISCIGRVAPMQPPGPDAEGDITATSLNIAADLGPANRLSVRWPHRRDGEQPLASFDTEELYWLKFDDEGARLEVRVRSKLNERELRQLTLQTTGKMTLASGTTGVESPAGAGGLPRKFQFPATVAGEKQTLTKAVFRLTDVSKAGRYVLPTFHIPGASARRLFFAVTPPAGLQVDAPVGLSAASAASFLKRWGAAGDTPGQAFAWDAAQPAASLLFSPTPKPRTTRQTLHYSVAQRTADVQYRAELDAADVNSSRLNYIVEIPTALVVHSVRAAALDDGEGPGEDAVAWWSQDGNTLQVFLKQALAGPHELLIDAAMPLPENGRVRLAPLLLRDVDLASNELFIYRHADVLVQVTPASDYENLPADPARHPQRGRLVAHLLSTARRPGGWRPVSLRATPNRPDARGVQLTRLVREGAMWNLIVDVDLQIQPAEEKRPQPVVDTLEFQLPAELADMLTFDPPIEHYFLPTQDPALRRVVLVPPTPIADAVRLRMIAADVIPPGQEVRAPDIRPVDSVRLGRYVAVPRALESQSIVWDTANLQAVNPPKAFESLGVEFRQHNTYRVLEDPFRVTLRSLRSQAGVPLVRLADVRFAWDGEHRCHGLATYDLEPAGLTSCQIEIPPPLQLLEVRVGDLPAQADKQSPHAWRVKLVDHNLPQRVEVLYAGAAAATGSPRKVSALAPRLADVTIQRTVWSVYAPAWAGVGECEIGGALDPVQQDTLRLKSLTELIRLPSLHRFEHSTSETRDWIAPWQSRWQRRRRDVIRGELLAGALTDGQFPRVDLNAVDQTYAQTMEELKLPAQDRPAAGPVPQADDLWEMSVSPQTLVQRRMVKGAGQSIALTYRQPSDGSGRLLRLGLIVVLILAAGLTATHGRWLPPSDWPLRSRHALGVLLGIGWALFLWPAAIGWAIVVLSLVTLRWRPKISSDRSGRPDIVVQSGVQMTNVE